MKYDVICIGSATLDTFIHTDKKFVKRKEYHFPIGSKILVNSIDYQTGGGGTNTSVCFSRLGLKTAFIGKLGCCDNSNFILRELKKEKIDISQTIISKKGKAGYSVIVDAKKTDRTIFAYKGLNECFKFNELNKKKLKNTKWIYLTSFTGKSFIESQKVAEFARKNNIKLAFNPSCYLTEKGYKFLKKIIDCTSCLILNKEEAEMLVKKGNSKTLAKKLHKLGPEIVVVTNANKGAWAYDGNEFYHSHQSKVNVTETTGAGDAFAATFVASLIKGKHISKSARLAQKNAESVITHIGAKNLLLSWNVLNKKI